MRRQTGFFWDHRVGVRSLVLAILLPILGCGDPDAGTIKAPKKEAMTGGGPAAGGSFDSGAKGKKQGRREVELKTMTPGGKKM